MAANMLLEAFFLRLLHMIPIRPVGGAGPLGWRTNIVPTKATVVTVHAIVLTIGAGQIKPYFLARVLVRTIRICIVVEAFVVALRAATVLRQAFVEIGV
jgi:hypothetical protein